jgi:hypothetical protein
VQTGRAASAAGDPDTGRLSMPRLPSPGNSAEYRQPQRMELAAAAGEGAKVKVPDEIEPGGSRSAVHRSLLAAEVTSRPKSLPKKAIYRLRTREKRKDFIRELGGNEETEEAVEAALSWLARTQSDDGRWDVDGFKTVGECGGAGDRTDADAAVTGLSLLAYLGAGYTHTQGDYKTTIRKALDWLLAGQKPDGDLRRGGQMYDQAMATAAICESYSLTGEERLLEPARRAVEFILAAQTPESGWRYQPREDSDTSVIGWQILALKSAEIAGIPIPEQHYRWTAAWLDQVRKGAEGGLYSYKPGHGVTQVMTAEGWFCQLFMSEKSRTRGESESIRYLMDNLPAWAPDTPGAIHFYYWYYGTLALHMSGAEEFSRWNSALTTALLKGRIKEGPAAGSWDPACPMGPRGGRIYSTAMATLCLEVYYRYLPFYKAY